MQPPVLCLLLHLVLAVVEAEEAAVVAVVAASLAAKVQVEVMEVTLNLRLCNNNRMHNNHRIQVRLLCRRSRLSIHKQIRTTSQRCQLRLCSNNKDLKMEANPCNHSSKIHKQLPQMLMTHMVTQLYSQLLRTEIGVRIHDVQTICSRLKSQKESLSKNQLQPLLLSSLLRRSLFPTVSLAPVTSCLLTDSNSSHPSKTSLITSLTMMMKNQPQLNLLSA